MLLPFSYLAALVMAPFPALAAMDLSFAPSSVKESLEARDEAAAVKCKQMFDCECSPSGEQRKLEVARGSTGAECAARSLSLPTSSSYLALNR